MTDQSPITTRIRLEGRCRSADRARWAAVLAEQLESRIHDPLWLLARQWQVSEFQAEDAGSPIHAELTATLTPLTGIRQVGQQDLSAVHDDQGLPQPLEPLVESEQPPQMNLQLAAEAGLHLLRLLGAGLKGDDQERLRAYRETYLQGKFALHAPEGDTLDPSSASWLAVMAKRAPNGRLLAAMSSADLLQAAGFDSSLQPDFGIHETWRASSLVRALSAPDPTSYWDEQRLEYRFELLAGTTPGSVCLTANEHSRDIAWHSFDASRLTAGDHPAPPPNAPAQPPPVKLRPLLSELRYAGMPNRRFWAFEDANVDFGSILAAPGDHARVLVCRFATETSNDWYLIPLTIKIGQLCQIQLTVHTVFGETVNVPAYADEPAGLTLFRFTTTDDSAASGILLLPLLSADTPVGAPLEETTLLRDEMSNTGFAIETIVETPAGRTRRRDEEPAPASPWATQPPSYALRHDPPPNWLALGQDPAHPSLLTVFGMPNGSVLAPEQPVFEEEIRYEGLTLRRNWRRARWLNGSTYTWINRSKTPGARNVSSGLRFDFLAGDGGSPE